MKGIIVGFDKINIDIQEEVEEEIKSGKKTKKRTKTILVPGEAAILRIQTKIPEILPVGKLVEITVIEPKKKKKPKDDDDVDDDEEEDDEEE